MTPDTGSATTTDDAVIADSGVREIVHLLGQVIAARGDLNAVRRQFMDGLCRIVRADSWVWCLNCQATPGEQPVYLGGAHGGFDEARYASLLQAAAHPDMAWASERLLAEMRDRADHVTRTRRQIVDETAFASSGVNEYLRAADIGPFVFSIRPIDDRSVSTVCLYRRNDDVPFSDRESRIVHIVLSELPWLHENGWPTDRGVTVPRLSPRLRLVLNLLLDGRTRKDMAASLSLSEYTVAQYQKAIYSHFGVNSQTMLLRRFQMGDSGDR